jgi:phosphohistidine phosphatase SixA
MLISTANANGSKFRVPNMDRGHPCPPVVPSSRFQTPTPDFCLLTPRRPVATAPGTDSRLLTPFFCTSTCDKVSGMKRTLPLIIVTVAILLAGCPSESVESPPVEEQKPLVVFLVRHAEKVDASKDPELSEEGKERSKALAEMLKSAKVEHIHSTDFIRTRDTAEPLAKDSGLEVEKYDPNDLEGFAKRLKKSGGRHLVVGHSNTTPELTKLLGGDPGTKINEKSEYDRLYVVTIGKDGTVNSALMRFGKSFGKESSDEEAKAAAK